MTGTAITVPIHPLEVAQVIEILDNLGLGYEVWVKRGFFRTTARIRITSNGSRVHETFVTSMARQRGWL